eukprot:1158456-Pelagomonas_calceolata.AAC.3
MLVQVLPKEGSAQLLLLLRWGKCSIDVCTWQVHVASAAALMCVHMPDSGSIPAAPAPPSSKHQWIS